MRPSVRCRWRRGLGVHDQQLAAGVDVARRQLVGLLHHEVGLEGHGGVGAARRDHVGPEGEVGHELPVHHVPLDAVDAGLLERGHLLAEPGEVGGQHGRGDLDGAVGSRVGRSSLPILARAPPAPARTLPAVEPSTLEITTIVAGGDGLGPRRRRAGRLRGRRPARRDGARSSVHEPAQGLRPGHVVEVLAAVARPRSSRRARSWPRAAVAATGSTSRPRGQRRLKADDRGRRAAAPGAARRARSSVGPEPAGRRATGRRCGASPSTVASGSGTGAATTSCAVGAVPGRPPAARRAGHRRPLPGRRGGAAGRGPHRRAARGRQRRSRAASRCPRACGSSPTAELHGGTRAWYHEEVAGRRWRISARSFFQARPDGAEALVDAVRARRWTARSRPAATSSTSTAASASSPARWRTRGQVTLVERAASSVADARVNLADQDARIVKADVGRWRAGPGRRGRGRPAPQPGSGAAGVAAVAATHAGRLVLVSCDPARARPRRRAAGGRRATELGRCDARRPVPAHLARRGRVAVRPRLRRDRTRRASSGRPAGAEQSRTMARSESST